ncbi:hypothetical protein BCR44DRAFT_1432622 [Catenaria anguillulae PL171]|uniref:Uncharacterized protein n=1 Tax=Catenaria anguillulae PL171 TaxID=765915 RepID=A0A1Y2HRR5_9FUNG|nr:hypothetical protein BCR44DRAFT_1432622 [Catenaria anguillulae PL171]
MRWDGWAFHWRGWKRAGRLVGSTLSACANGYRVGTESDIGRRILKCVNWWSNSAVGNVDAVFGAVVTVIECRACQGKPRCRKCRSGSNGNRRLVNRESWTQSH